MWRFFFNKLLLRFGWSLKYIRLFGNWKLLLGMSFLCFTVVPVLILSWNASILLSCDGTFSWLGRLLLFLVIENVHKLFKNLLVLNVHTGIHMLIIFLQFLFRFIIGSCRVLDILLRLFFIIISGRRDWVFIFIGNQSWFVLYALIRIFLRRHFFLFFLLLIRVDIRFKKVGYVSDILRL